MSRDGRQLFVCHCPRSSASILAQRIAAEERRLAGPVGQIFRRAPPTFAGYDPRRHDGADDALAEMQRFAAGRPPLQRVVLLGPSGLGKTRLQLAAHFELLRAGVESRFIRAIDLRQVLLTRFGAGNTTPDERAAARAEYAALCRAAAVFIDDLGNQRPTPSQEMAAHLQALLEDAPTTCWCVSIGLDDALARQHPDIGWPLLSRLIDGGVLVLLRGENVRAAQASVIGAG